MVKKIRKGCKDVWNAFMTEGAIYDGDIPLCPTTGETPESIITWEEAVNIYRKKIAYTHRDFKCNSYITFNLDDYKFDDGKYDIWMYPYRALKIIMHFTGIITPDFSTYVDMPEPIKFYNTYRMRAFGFWCVKSGVKVINNVRWDFTSDYAYCFKGIPKNSIVLIGTVASGLRQKENHFMFEKGLLKLVEILNPRIILTYGSANYPCFEKLKESGIIVKSYPSRKSICFKGGNKHV